MVYSSRKVSDLTPEPQRSFLSYAIEEQHGYQHQLKWARVLLATGYSWEGYSSKMMENIFRAAERAGPMDYKECLEFYEQHGRNQRWTKAKEWFEQNTLTREEAQEAFEADRKRKEELRKYEDAPPVQGNYSAEQWRARYGKDPDVVIVLGWGKYIIDPQVREPLWGLDGDFPARGAWKYTDEGRWVDLDAPPADAPDAAERAAEEPADVQVVEVPTPVADAIQADDWATVAGLAIERIRKDK